MAWIPRPSRADPDEGRELERWPRERAARDALDEVDPTLWDPEHPEAPSDGDDEDEPDPALHTKPRIAVYAATAAVWLGVVTVLHLHWWTFERSLFVSIFAPFLLGRLVERLILRARPELNRHRAEEEAVLRRSRQKAAELGERARPYWAREAADALGDGERRARGDGSPSAGVPDSGETRKVG